MRQKWLVMRYNKDLDYWLAVEGDSGYMMHCGKSFEICIGGDRSVPCRLELGSQWYVFMGSAGVKFNLRKNEIYKIKL